MSSRQEISFYDLGFKDYLQVWDFQKKYHERVVLGQVSEALILVEHNHVYTCGRSWKKENQTGDPCSAEIFRTNNPIFLIRVERGGGLTYHGPGQIVGYPIIDLNIRGFGVSDFLRRLENVLIHALSSFGIEAHVQEGLRGVWVRDKKIASIGIAVKRWVTYHGFALNVNTDLSFFKAIQPCGLSPDVMTSMKGILGSEVDTNEVKKVVKSFFYGVSP